MKKVMLIALMIALSLSGCTSKPSKQQVKKVFTASLQKELGTASTPESQQAVQDYASCIVDETYDHLSAKTLRQIVDAKTSDSIQNIQGSQEEKDILDKAAVTCKDKLVTANS